MRKILLTLIFISALAGCGDSDSTDGAFFEPPPSLIREGRYQLNSISYIASDKQRVDLIGAGCIAAIDNKDPELIIINGTCTNQITKEVFTYKECVYSMRIFDNEIIYSKLSGEFISSSDKQASPPSQEPTIEETSKGFSFVNFGMINGVEIKASANFQML